MGETDNGSLEALLVPYPSDQMRMWEISLRVNSPKNDDPSLSVLPILGEPDFSEELLQNTVGFKPLKLADQTRANFGSRRIAES